MGTALLLGITGALECLAIAPSEGERVAPGMQEAATPARLTTTLYDLIAALQDVVGPDDNTQVVPTMVHLLRSGRLTWGGAVAELDRGVAVQKARHTLATRIARLTPLEEPPCTRTE